MPTWHEDYKKYDGLMSWLRLLHKFDDDLLQKVCGSDAALYLVFLRDSALFFGIIAVLNIAFIFIFATGEPMPSDNFELHSDSMFAMQALTILNITNTPWKVWLCFFNCMLTIGALSFSLIFTYTNKFKNNERFMRERIDSFAPRDEEREESLISETDIARHSIMVQNLPKDISRQDAENLVRNVVE